METTAAVLRLMSDLNAINHEPPSGCSAGLVNEHDLMSWSATIFGPESGPFEGGVFTLRLNFTDQYPQKPPKVRFLTQMYHPNVYSDGSICLDILQDKWAPIYSVSTILVSIQSLLTDPNPSSPANPEAANLYTNNREEYNRRVRKCAMKSIEG